MKSTLQQINFPKKELSFNYQGLKVAVFGLGVSGVSAIKLLVALGAEVSVFNRGNPEDYFVKENLRDLIDLKNCFSDDVSNQEAMAKNQLIILSPGIAREHDLLMRAHEKHIPVWAEIELAYEFCEKPIIAITGTNGKTTTTTLVGELIEKAGKKVFVGGNIGTPFCEYARLQPNVDVVLLELSSFQLESIVKFRPNVALFLNLYQNHGERYSDIQDYGDAKARISLNMQNTDTVIYATNFPYIHQWARTLKTKTIALDLEHLPNLFEKNKLKIPGNHNVINATFALLSVKELGLDSAKVLNALYEFKGVHHRIEFVENSLGFLAYDDAKSTNWDATLTALKAVERTDKNLKLILGGKKRGHGDSVLPYLLEIEKFANELLLIGEMGKEIEMELAVDPQIKISFRYLATIEKVVSTLQIEKFQGTLLFSPAFPSFDQFKNYEDRGRSFQRALTNRS